MAPPVRQFTQLVPGRRYFGLLLSPLAFLWRRLMIRTTFIAVTGSVGKTTATGVLGAMLSSRFPTNWLPGGNNSRFALGWIILHTRLRHRFTVIEVGTRRPGALRRASWMINPDIAVVLKVAQVHSDHFPTLDHVAAEKAKILGRLGPSGFAVLNADDPRVAAMAAICPSPVRTFGRSPGSFVRATDVSSCWPSRLSFRVSVGAESCQARTNFVGEHFLPSLLAALTVAVCCGMPLPDAVAVLANLQPIPGRMDPNTLPNGAVFLRDEYNPSMPSLEAGLRVLEEAQAGRKIVVMGDVLDTCLSVRSRFRDLGQRAARAADAAVFVGRYGHLAVTAAVTAGMKPESAKAFPALPDAAAYLRSELKSGDLVLLHGWTQRHMERIHLAQFTEVRCWKDRCAKIIQCENCPELRRGKKPA